MEKDASDLLRLALLGLLTGGGAYSGMRLMHDIPAAAKGPEKPKDQLELTLPSTRLPKTANDAGAHSPLDYLLPLLAYGGGATGGFLGASSLYDKYRQHELDNKEQDVEKQYMHTLQQAHSKVASVQTPNVDKFLEGLLSKVGEELQKEGFWGVDMPTEGPVDTLTHAGKGAMSGLAHTGLGSAAIAAWLTATLGAGGATYAIANKMDQQKKSNQEKTTLPSEIKLNVAHSH